MDEVNANAVEVGAEVLEPVQGALLRPPVEPVGPVVEQFAQIGEVGARPYDAPEAAPGKSSYGVPPPSESRVAATTSSID